MIENISKAISKVLAELSLGEVSFVVESSDDFDHGDYSSNVALIATKQAGEQSRMLAERIKSNLLEQKIEYLEKIEIAGAGFINFFFTPSYYIGILKKIIESSEQYGYHNTLAGKKVMIEYTDPNPFKEFHIGHLMPNVIGESLSRLIEWGGANVLRVNYQGDVGLHVAKAIWGKSKHPEQDWGESYVAGSRAYENDEISKQEITTLNQKIYSRSDENTNKLYDEGRKESLDKFEEIYKTLGTKFDHYYFESQMAEPALSIVRKNNSSIFEKSEEAIVFKAEKFDQSLHTRVFINKEGLPTYEAKELALAERKFKDENPDHSIIVTGNEIKDYYRVVMKALSFIDKKAAEKTLHISHGILRLPEGKMSSRKGNVITGESLIAQVEKLALEKMTQSRHLSEKEKKEVATQIAVGAIKYSILKQAIGKDIIFYFEKSLSFEGDSGPYLQYTYARTQSVLAKARELNLEVQPREFPETGPMGTVERLLERFPQVTKRALTEYAPQLVATYLIELASAFNAYYAKNQIVNPEDKETSEYRITLTRAVGVVLKNGLWLLGIKVPQRM